MNGIETAQNWTASSQGALANQHSGILPCVTLGLALVVLCVLLWRAYLDLQAKLNAKSRVQTSGVPTSRVPTNNLADLARNIEIAVSRPLPRARPYRYQASIAHAQAVNLPAPPGDKSTSFRHGKMTDVMLQSEATGQL